MTNLVQKRLNKISNIRKSRENRYPDSTRIFYTGKNSAGVTITPDTALTISTVWACCVYLSQNIGLLPWTVNEMIGGGIRERAAHPVNYMLKHRVSREYSSFQFRETLMHWALRWGNGYAEIERDILGRAIAFWPIHPSRVRVYRDAETLELFYQVTSDTGGFTVIDQMDMFHIRGFGDTPVGVNVIQYANESLAWVKAVQMFGAGFFGNGANPSGIITTKKPLSPAGLKNVRTEFEKLYKGPNNANSTVVLDNEMEYQALSITPENGQFISTNQHLVDEVCRWFGVPPHKIYHLLRATFSNIEHQSIEVVTDSLMPWAKRFNDEATFKLFGMARPTYFCDMDFTELLKGDSAARVAYYNAMRNMGAMNANEIRRREGMNSIGPDGDKYLIQSQYTTLEMIGREPEPVTALPVSEPEPEMPDISENRAFYLLTENLMNEGYLL